jgi:hypothetical protein
MGSEKIHKGSCFCGEVQFEVSGEPAGMGYCHCESCRHWSAGPVNAFTLWNPQSLKAHDPKINHAAVLQTILRGKSPRAAPKLARQAAKRQRATVPT